MRNEQKNRIPDAKQAVVDAEQMLQVFEGMVSSCHDRGTLPSDLYKVTVKRSRNLRRKLRNSR
jgi:hypothetical protein